MNEEFQPRGRGHTIGRRIARNVLLSAFSATVGLKIAAVVNRPEHSHDAIGFLSFLVGAPVFGVSLIFAAMNILIGCYNPKEFASIFKDKTKPPQQPQLPF